MQAKEDFTRLELGRVTHNLRLCLRNQNLRGEPGRRRVEELIARLYTCSPRNACRLAKRLQKEGYLVARRPHRRKAHVRWALEPQ